MHCSLKSVVFWRNKTVLDTTHSHTSQQHMPQLWNQQQMTTQVLLHRHTDDEFCTNCCSCGGQGVTGNTLTLQGKDPSAEQYGSLPMVVKCQSEQILWGIFLATESFVFSIQFLQNSIQYTTNNFPNTSAVQFPAQADCFFQTFLQPSSETHPVSYPKITLGSYPNSKFSVTVTVLRLRIWSLNVMPVQRQFTFYPRTQCDWINNRGHTYKNTTHQHIIMHYLEFIFLNCTAVMPQTLPLTFQSLSNFQFPFTWWWKIDLLMSSCIIHLSFYLLKKKLLEF